MTKDKEINLSEFCYALGRLIIEKANVFWDINKANEDLANEIGYSTLGIVLSVSNNKLHNIPDYRTFFSSPDKIEDLLEKVLREFDVLNSHFKKYLALPGLDAKYESRAATNFQILSYFASIWSINYKYNPETGEIIYKEKYKKYTQLFKNFIVYYVKDISTSRWSGTGDTKLNDIYIKGNQRYLENLDFRVVEQDLLNWNYDNLNKPSLNIDNVSKAIYVIYLSFYSNVHKEPSYDFEHIFPRARYKDYYKKYNLPLGTVGNIMLLDSKINRSKKENHILGNLSTIAKLNNDFISIHEYPDTNILKKLPSTLNKSDLDNISLQIKNRSKKLINNLIKNLGKSM